ncbi:ribosomal-protein-alanine N-acetyltransferase [Pseudoalteromonas translucida KMM 520]|uniref:Ribosomal-protein-alanine N-acetyltransferase n=1 Tax=Pseudoalteromonas translucida KMM 520 TaxID=1315283 RepID=A0A0U2V5N0_9GAMM|nr:GNAT family N-acetyltransferase [Pseudoalteromonas translucida]ALS33100.1 ribosomal-protein-alanine N-acetyltransferase [Pseudoalteromonas translucida KMM 520]
MFKTITLPRVTLRLITHKHGAALFGILNHPLVSQYNDYQTPLSQQQVKQLIQNDISGYFEGEVLRLAIEHNSNGQLLGSCGLYKINTDTQTAFIGFELHPDFWQQGIMQEVLLGFMAVMPALQLKHLYAEVSAHNQRSHALLIKLGFKPKCSVQNSDNSSLWCKLL